MVTSGHVTKTAVTPFDPPWKNPYANANANLMALTAHGSYVL